MRSTSSDAYALEEALQLKEKHGCEVVSLLAVRSAVADHSRSAANGAGRSIHIEWTIFAALDTLGIASLLAAAIKDENPTSSSLGCNRMTSAWARLGRACRLLGIPHATIIMQVEAGTAPSR